MYCFIYLKVLRVDTKIKSRLFADRLIVSILFRCKWFSIILLRWHDWKISKQSSNQFLMLQKNCLKFSFDTYRYTYIISSFVFRHTFQAVIYSSYFLFEIRQIFLYFHFYTNFPAPFSASIHTYGLSLKITVYILSNIFSYIIFWK